jgi:hypothetical protein
MLKTPNPNMLENTGYDDGDESAVCERPAPLLFCALNLNLGALAHRVVTLF